MKAEELAKQFSLSELQTDYFRLPVETVLKLRRLANKYGLGKNKQGRSRGCQLWYSMQRTIQKDSRIMKDRKQLEGWEWNESLSQYERGDFRVVEYNDDGRIYHRLQIRSNKHPEFNRSKPIEFEHIDIVCRIIVGVVKRQYGVKLEY